MSPHLISCPKKGHIISKEQCLARQQKKSFRCLKSCPHRRENRFLERGENADNKL